MLLPRITFTAYQSIKSIFLSVQDNLSLMVGVQILLIPLYIAIEASLAGHSPQHSQARRFGARLDQSQLSVNIFVLAG